MSLPPSTPSPTSATASASSTISPQAFTFTEPKETLAQIADLAAANLTSAVSIDSQSDETAQGKIPSTPGQIAMGEALKKFFSGLGLSAVNDARMSVIVTIPSNISGAQPPPTALMVHMDTSKGTSPLSRLHELPNWDGKSISYSEVPELEVNASRYPHIAPLVGQTLLHGGGKFPFGLDDKNGMAELMTMAQLLVSNPSIPHGEIILGFRCDEEIGSHAAVTSLADLLAARGVTFGWTVDGTTPFEINTSNFNASRADILLETKALEIPNYSEFKEVSVDITGVDTHGATAKEEGYLNAAIVFARLVKRLENQEQVLPVAFDRTGGKETFGTLKVLICGSDAQDIEKNRLVFTDALEAEISPHRWKGADFKVTAEPAVTPETESYNDGALRVAGHLLKFLAESKSSPLLSEESSGDQGYTNPHYVAATEKGYVVRYRIRDFSVDGLKNREEDLSRICQESGLGTATITQQYVDMGPSLQGAPQLTALPRAAFEPLRPLTNFAVLETPIRGGTGVDEFTKRGVYVGNLGAGYFFLESGKELTTRELLALHTRWLLNLVQAVGSLQRQ